MIINPNIHSSHLRSLITYYAMLSHYFAATNIYPLSDKRIEIQQQQQQQTIKQRHNSIPVGERGETTIAQCI